MNWAFNQKDISNYHNNYSYLMKFWNSKIPGIYVEYEKLVSDKKNEIEKLLEFCELNWMIIVLIIIKILKRQLKQLAYPKPVNLFISSVRSSDNYQDHLKEMFENLI